MRAALSACGALVLLGALLVLTVPLLPAVIIGCALQALGTAGLTSIAMSLTNSARSMGFVTASLAVVGSTAPLVGSLVNDAINWQATLALPALSLIALLVIIGRASTRPTSTAAFDGLGAVLLTAVVTALVFVPHYPPVAGILSVVTIAALVWHLRSKPQGFVPAVVVRSPVFLISSVLAFLLAAVNFGLMFAVPEASRTTPRGPAARSAWRWCGRCCWAARCRGWWSPCRRRWAGSRSSSPWSP